jgi:hypothetical protein
VRGAEQAHHVVHHRPPRSRHGGLAFARVEGVQQRGGGLGIGLGLGICVGGGSILGSLVGLHW